MPHGDIILTTAPGVTPPNTRQSQKGAVQGAHPSLPVSDRAPHVHSAHDGSGWYSRKA